MMMKNSKVTPGPIRLSILAAVVLTLTACTTAGDYTNSDNDSYGKKNTTATFVISAPFTKVDTTIGPVIAGGPDNMTLYFYDNDSANISNCNDGCIAAWPPFSATDSSLVSDTLTMVTRSDGSKQWAIAGKPVYFWAGDQKSGDTTGSNAINWTVVTPDGL